MATLPHTTAAAASALGKPTSLTSTATTKPLPHLSFPFSPSKTLTLTAKTTSIKSAAPSSSDLSTTTVTTTTTTSISTTPQTLKSRLQNGDTLYGIFLLSFSPTLAEIAGLSGYDFVVVDMEHGPGGISEALSCLRALAATQTPAILRLPESSATWAKKALDLGPQGIMFPMIESSKEAEKAVSYCRFPPAGIRGSAHTVVRASSYGIDEGYLSNYDDQLLIMCQVESEQGVKRAEEIAAVEGVDCVQMGPLDLSASMGYLWDPGNKKVRNALKGAEKAVLGTDPLVGGAYLCGFAMPHDGPQDLRTRGYHMVSGCVDVGLFRSAAVEDVRRFRLSLINGSDDEEEHGNDADEKYWSE
ncbi:PREDICTED: uncharacterized protein LOC101294232 [Fragaria vesca subsp. vesca]|uniref:uncharacterized protein LOC101294232 n=1 Tax=Fragaria vesca subsp. vesca TaxID=101020 RepID=UPI0002C31954|nr:PREDICTED: uncharacterized protein LOC101294232 [Fragaria vesca subsp. vesca]